MNLTVLIDLDGTLLENGFQDFQRAYLNALSKAMGLEPSKMIPVLMSATNKMLQKNQPGGTLEDTFDSHFYPALGLAKESLRERIDDFYARVFPTFRPLTSPHPQARSLVEELLARGATLALATNPLFPQTAICQRLEWAGFPLEKYPFAIVPGFQSFHFAKPNPAYFAELLGQLGCPNQPAVMLGDDLDLDILPSAQMGIPGYWLNHLGGPLPVGSHPMGATGEMSGFLAWVDSVLEQLPEAPQYTSVNLLPTLKATPAVMETLSGQINPGRWSERAIPGEWSLTEIFCHLRDVESEINLPRVELLCREENPFLPGIDSDSWAEIRGYAQQNGTNALRSFFESRIRLCAELERLGDCCWERRARHAIFGPTRLFELATFMATHDRSHIQQVYEDIRAAA